MKINNSLTLPSLKVLISLDEKKFRERFAGTPVRRLGYERFLRNTLIAIGNSKDKFFIKPVMKKLDHVDILVRGMAVWALFKLSNRSFIREKEKRLCTEKDHSVKNEWKLGSFYVCHCR